MTPSEIEVELQALRQEIATLKQQQKPARTTRVRWATKLGLGLVLAACALASTNAVLAANGNCPNGLPFCFVSGQPAKAAQINENFAQLKEWLENKVGATSTSNANMGTATATTFTATTATATNFTTTSQTMTGDLTMNGNAHLLGGNSAGNLHIDSRKTGADGRIYLNWFDGKGVVLGNGSGSAVAYTDNSTNTMIISGRHFPSTVVRNNCTCGGTSCACAASCPSGYIIKAAHGRHGATITSDSGDWNCGGVFQWMGSCLDKTTCTVSAGCSTASLEIECW